MKAVKRMRGFPVVVAAVVAGGLAFPGTASAGTTATGPCARQTGPCEALTVTIRPHGSGGGNGGQGNQGGGGSKGGRSGSAGSLSLTVPASATLTVASNGTTAKGYLEPMRVSDTRQSSPGWTVFGQASVSGGVLSADDVGWTPSVTGAAGQVTAGRPVPPNRPGLGAVPAKLGSSTGPGTATLGASLFLSMPPRQVIGPHGVPPARTIILSLTITLTTTAA